MDWSKSNQSPLKAIVTRELFIENGQRMRLPKGFCPVCEKYRYQCSNNSFTIKKILS